MTDTQSPSTGSSIRFIISEQRRPIATMAFTAFLGGAAEAVFLIVVTRIAFAITDGDRMVEVGLGVSQSIGATLAFTALLVVCRLLLAAVAARQGALATAAAVAAVRRTLADSYLAADWPTQQSQPAGSLQQLMSGYSNNAATMVQGIAQFAVQGANLFALLLLAVFVDVVAATSVIAIAGVLGLVLRPVRKALRRRSIQEAQLSMKLAGSTSELSQLGLELHVFDVQEAARGQLENSIVDLETASRRVALARNMLTPVYSGLAYLALVAALTLAVFSDDTSIESLGAGMLVMLRSLGYAQGVQGSVASILSNAPAVGELRLVVKDLDEGRRSSGETPIHEVGSVQVKAVSFSYRTDDPVLTAISFELRPLEVVGIVGPSGSGKSTLVELLLGLREPTEGTITADGRDINQFSTSEWCKRVTFVPQRPRMIQGTISDNIRFFRDNVSDEEVRRAARLAHLSDDIAGFADGYGRRIGAEDGQLSGGQEQRIAIARALVERPSLLILDEPTSALDARSEAAIRRTLESLREQMSIVIIAHRLSTLDTCDKLIVIEDGELKAFAEPKWLAANSDFFKGLIEHSTIE